MATEVSASSRNLEEPLSASQHSDINEHQAKAFAELKSLCEKNQIYWPASEIEGYPAEGHNDNDSLLYAVHVSSFLPKTTTYLLCRRFLAARSYNPQAAYKQYSASVAWRSKVALVKSYDDTEIQSFERMNRVVSHPILKWTPYS